MVSRESKNLHFQIYFVILRILIQRKLCFNVFLSLVSFTVCGHSKKIFNMLFPPKFGTNCTIYKT